jgi:hypothetical protein
LIAEFVTFHFYGVMEEYQTVEQKTTTVKVNMRLVQIHGYGNNAYLAFVPQGETIDGRHLRLEPDQQVAACFDMQKDMRSRDWYGRVLSQKPYFTPSWDACFILHRRFYKADDDSGPAHFDQLEIPPEHVRVVKARSKRY